MCVLVFLLIIAGPTGEPMQEEMRSNPMACERANSIQRMWVSAGTERWAAWVEPEGDG